MSIIIPDAILHATSLSEEEMKVEVAVMLYDRADLSIGKAAEFAGMDRYLFWELLASRGFDMEYGVRDFEDDLATLRGRRQL